jgi:putative endonuclease
LSFFSRKDSTPLAASLPERQARGRAARASGYDAEAAAAEFLQAQGVSIIGRNVRCKGGEIDLIGKDTGTLLFIEVRLRKSIRFGGAAESITVTKQRRIALAARYFLFRNPALTELPCRFDCVLMNAPGNFEWLRDAFRLD